MTGKCLSNGFKYFHAWRFLIFSQPGWAVEQSSIFHLQFLFSDARKAGLDKNSESVPSEIWFTSTHRQRYQHHRWFIPATNRRPESVQHWPIRGRVMDPNDLTRYCSWEIVQAASTDLEFRQWAERGERAATGGTFILFARHCPDTYFLFRTRDLLFAKIMFVFPRLGLSGEAIILRFSKRHPNTPNWKIRLQSELAKYIDKLHVFVSLYKISHHVTTSEGCCRL